MNRREALKNTALVLGYSVTGSALAGVLNGCKADPKSGWSPAFFIEKQVLVMAELAEHILPKSDTPGAKDVLTDRFMDSIMNDYFSKEDREKFSKGLDDFEANCQKNYGSSFLQMKPEQRDELLTRLEKESPTTRPSIWGNPVGEEMPWSFYRQFKELTMLGYFTSEQVGKHILKYDPVPGKYEGCVPLAKIGNAWSLG